MSSCPGKQMETQKDGTRKAGFTCTNMLYRCKKCGAVGCQRKNCTNYNFDGSRCLKCGNYGATNI